MIYKNAEIHNTGALIEGSSAGSTRWIRVPQEIYTSMETEQGKRQCLCSTGVELRFVMNSDTVTLRMKTYEGEGIFHVFRGSLQGGWEDHEVNKNVMGNISDFIIKKSEKPEKLEAVRKQFNQPFSSDVVRVIFDRGHYELIDIIGDIRPPKKAELPQKTLLAYGSSITHGSNSIDMSHSWVSVIAHNLHMDARNLGMAGSCLMEPAIIDYIASEGEKGLWDMAVLELGINVLSWNEEKIKSRVSNVINQIPKRNPDKPVFILSPIYCYSDEEKTGEADLWRKIIKEEIEKSGYTNVTYVSGIDLIEDMSKISADCVHPDIYGVMQIASRLEQRIRQTLPGDNPKFCVK